MNVHPHRRARPADVSPRAFSSTARPDARPGRPPPRAGLNATRRDRPPHSLREQVRRSSAAGSRTRLRRAIAYPTLRAPPPRPRHAEAWSRSRLGSRASITIRREFSAMANEHDQSEPRPSTAGETPASSANPTDNGDATTAGNDSPDRLVATLNAGVDRILRAFDEKIRYDETKQQAIDRQHEELLGYRADLVARAAGPFIYGMIHHHGEISRLVAAVRQETAAEMPSAKVCNLLESLQQDVEQVLGEKRRHRLPRRSRRSLRPGSPDRGRPRPADGRTKPVPEPSPPAWAPGSSATARSSTRPACRPTACSRRPPPSRRAAAATVPKRIPNTAAARPPTTKE